MISIVKIISARIEEGRRKIKSLRLGRSDVKETFESLPHGIDSVPVEGLRAIYLETGQKGKNVVIGFINVNQLAALKPGETRIFSTEEDGTLSFDIKLLQDGFCEIGGNADFIAGFNDLKSGFDQLKSDFNAFLTHVHGASGTPPAPPALPSTASIDNAKKDKIKTL